ncbi:MAG: (Fe-S)-binding protein [Cytophagales bacterium]|nr:(Fe-S)-binding protein [Cytophagales bacterium]MDW8384556.1 (Fe-S)-binding protein [Flammeovirgaceae bacterium]
MAWIQQIFFVGVVIAMAVWIGHRASVLKRNIFLGKDESLNDSNPKKRWLNMLKKAFGQQKMFDRPIVGVLHGIIYASFFIINIEILEIFLDGFTGKHRIFAPHLGNLYTFLINFFELLAFGVLVACVVFLVRRYVLKIPRFRSPELSGFPIVDAAIILVWEIFLMLALYTMNATDSLLQERAEESEYIASHFPKVGSFWVSQFLMPLWKNYDTTTLLVVERIAWWMHILGILGFAVYITYSKHLHILLAFFHTYYANQTPKGKMVNMPEVEAEVKTMLGLSNESFVGAPSRFGVKDVTDLSWRQILSAYACTECGRCTSVCPANLTGKKLSPRKIVMDVRDRADELGNFLAQNSLQASDGKSLYGDYVTKEELLACTTCNACVEACPIDINPLEIILEMRRYMVLEESSAPQSWNVMFHNIENKGAPWAFASQDRKFD